MPQTDKMDAIIFDDVTLTYAHKPVLLHFQAHIRQGEFIGIFGANGSGKSTLLRSLLGLIAPQQGNILILGQPVERGCAYIGYMPQYRNIISSGKLSAKERLLASLKGYRFGFPLYSLRQLEEVEWVIDKVEARHFIHRPFTELSGGERQRVLLAQALLSRPKILLLDEPLMHLDMRQQERMIELIQHIQQELSSTVLFTSHSINPLLKVMNRVIYLAQHRGMIGSLEETLNEEKLSLLFGFPVEVVRYKEQVFIMKRNIEISGYECHH